MPRAVPHFKVFCSASNHRRLLGLWADDALLAMWVRAGVLCIERFADKTGDRCLVSRRDLLVVANTEPWANAAKKLRRLCSATPLRVRCDCAGSPLETRCDCAGIWLVFPNFAKKQFQFRENGKQTGPSSSSSSSSSEEEEKEHGSKTRRVAREAPATSAAPDDSTLGTRGDPKRWARLFATEAGSLEAAEAFVTDVLQLIEAKADVEVGAFGSLRTKAERRKWSDFVRERLIAFWRWRKQHPNAGTTKPWDAPRGPEHDRIVEEYVYGRRHS